MNALKLAGFSDHFGLTVISGIGKAQSKVVCFLEAIVFSPSDYVGRELLANPSKHIN